MEKYECEKVKENKQEITVQELDKMIKESDKRKEEIKKDQEILEKIKQDLNNIHDITNCDPSCKCHLDNEAKEIPKENPELIQIEIPKGAIIDNVNDIVLGESIKVMVPGGMTFNKGNDLFILGHKSKEYKIFIITFPEGTKILMHGIPVMTCDKMERIFTGRFIVPNNTPLTLKYTGIKITTNQEITIGY